MIVLLSIQEGKMEHKRFFYLSSKLLHDETNKEDL